jgi:hypothetical protein
MRRALALVVLFVLSGATLGGAAAAEPDAAVVFDAQRAHVYASASGGPLLDASAAANGTDLAKAFLRARAKTAATVDSLKTDNEFAHRGVTFLRLRQEIGGLRVAGAYVRAAIDARGNLVHVIENIVDVRGGPAKSQLTAEQALAAALARVHPGLAERPAIARRNGNVTTFRQTASFAAAPAAERVLLARASGALEEAFLVDTWTRAGNLLHRTLVDRGGGAVSSELRTANDNYNVFTEDPSKTPQAVVAGPGAGNAESPAGWLGTGEQLTTHLSGNNANAYLDRNANNRPDRGGTAVTDGNFLTAATLGSAPTDTNNQAVSVQNLFYLNSVIHDILYDHGFIEVAGNFQEDNFANGGADSDSVNAESQDGSGTDNANFATPPDGSNPRMQMFLWTGAGNTHEVVVGATTYPALGAAFGKPLTTTGTTGPIVLVNDGVGTTSDGCEPLARRSLLNAIALVDRGTCTFTAKVKNAQTAGAIGAIVANNVAGDPFTMGGADKSIRIGSVMISQADGVALKGSLPVSGTIRLKAVQPLQIDSSLDSDIVFHEYGHGLTWRMIGGMSGPLAGAVGEGASDGVSMLVNGDDRVAEYSASDPAGIRRFPYTGYPNTYSDVTGAEVHDDGEIYAAIVWRLMENYSGAAISNSDLFDTWVGGMNFTPATPAYEDMRDGMLASAPASEDCLIWDAFADYGVGVGADGVVNADGTVTITESFALPAECTAP